MKKKKVGDALVASPSKISLIICILSLTIKSHAVSSNIIKDGTIKTSVHHIFNGIPVKKLCKKLRRQKITETPGTKAVATYSFKYIDEGLDSLLNKLITGIEQSDQPQVRKLFHPSLKVSSASINNVLAKIKGNNGKNVRLSVEKLWALYTLDGSAENIPCEEDNISISPQYGYDLQFAAWISVAGEKELAKIFISVVPVKENLFIGAFNLKNWTHNGKDHLSWIKEADKDYKDKIFGIAYLKYDIARKLLFGKSYYEFDDQSKIEEFIEQNLNKKQFEKAIQDELTQQKILRVNSILATGGVGLMIRFLIEKEWSAHAIREHCKKNYLKLNEKKWFKNLNSLRCGYNLPHEKDPTRDGILGSILIDHNSFI